MIIINNLTIKNLGFRSFYGKVCKLFCLAFFVVFSIVIFTSLSLVSNSFAAEFEKNPNLPLGSPEILYAHDINLYKQIYEDQKVGNLDDAKAKMKLVENKILFGYYYYQRFMSPYYKTNYAELKKWLDNYSDLPLAQKIYDLAVKKAGKDFRKIAVLKQPSSPTRSAYYTLEDRIKTTSVIRENYSDKKAKKIVKSYDTYMKKGLTLNAKNLLNDKNTKKLISKADQVRMASNLAYKYFIDNLYDDAIKWAKVPADENDPNGLWTLALSYYHEGQYADGKKYFIKLMKNNSIDVHKQAAAAYWAYRCNEKLPDGERVSADSDKLLKFAAMYPMTFYGVIARYQLGMDLKDNWEVDKLSFDDAKEIISWAGGVRAVALLQLGFKSESVNELRYLAFNSKNRNDDNLIRVIMSYANLANMGNLSVKLAPYFKDENGNVVYNSFLFPDLQLENENDWQVDRALVNSFVRQESMFQTEVKSDAGAIGLMQLLPSTAKWITDDSDASKFDADITLQDPSYNVYVGQKYVNYLLNLPTVNYNLIKLIIAYNAGPGMMNQWATRISQNVADDDPLFFIESIRAKETRIHVQKVLMNFWHYRDKYGQKITSLDDLIAGRWPKYENKDVKGTYIVGEITHGDRTLRNINEEDSKPVAGAGKKSKTAVSTGNSAGKKSSKTLLVAKSSSGSKNKVKK